MKIIAMIIFVATLSAGFYTTLVGGSAAVVAVNYVCAFICFLLGRLGGGCREGSIFVTNQSKNETIPRKRK